MKRSSYISGKLITFCIATVLAFLSSCQEVIDIDLDSRDPVLVIEGEVNDQPGPCTVKLTTTVNFDEPNVFPGVQGATVTLSDNIGTTVSLAETSPGIYTTNAITGTPGRNYFLKVQSGGKEYQATSSLASPVLIDTVLVDSFTFGQVSNKFLNVIFTDPPNVKNFYRIIEIINGDTLDIINLSNDEFEDGDQITVPVFSDEDPKLKSGDHVVIVLQTIDENVFEYFRQLIDVINNGGQSAAPANPLSNISNGALGYFSAYSQRSKALTIP